LSPAIGELAVGGQFGRRAFVASFLLIANHRTANRFS
jgi:hypothetical protein